jgi:hypothetical protein
VFLFSGRNVLVIIGFFSIIHVLLRVVELIQG